MMMSDTTNEAIRWCKENGYEHIIENEDLAVAVYKKKVLGQSFRRSGSNIPFKKIGELEKGEKGKVIGLVVEVIRERKTKSGKWQVRLIAGDDSKMVEFVSFPFEMKPEIEEGEYYLFEGKYAFDEFYKKEIFSWWSAKKIERNVVDKVFIVKDYIDTIGGGKEIKKDKFDRIVNEEYREKVKDIMGLRDDGDKYAMGR